ncbi:hypothetical protein SAMN05421763_11464 [[Luteovulum] sphaeroides subsp. megalophilum]|nr:hypothetical protein SAMN05421763_11464 [[Luteovulum] sphaeroides subsp. megalophilum]
MGALTLDNAGAEPGLGITVLRERTADELAGLLFDSRAILLHFSGYGYARRGLCRWLSDGLAQWKGAGTDRRLVTIFHEVYATGPVWRSSFWTARPQKRIARHIAHLSDAAFVTSEGGMGQLRQMVPHMPLSLLPVFSNVGEPAACAPLAERSPRAVVFGGARRRLDVYEALAATKGLERRLAALGLVGIIDVGPPSDVPEVIAGLPVERCGPLPADQVSAILADAQIGLVDYPGHVFTKSGIAAAYFAHGLAVVNTSQCGGFPADLVEGKVFSGLPRFVTEEQNLQALSDAGRAWYAPHAIPAAAARIRESLA